MDILKQADLTQLLESPGYPCLSLYMPTRRAGEGEPATILRYSR